MIVAGIAADKMEDSALRLAARPAGFQLCSSPYGRCWRLALGIAAGGYPVLRGRRAPWAIAAVLDCRCVCIADAGISVALFAARRTVFSGLVGELGTRACSMTWALLSGSAGWCAVDRGLASRWPLACTAPDIARAPAAFLSGRYAALFAAPPRRLPATACSSSADQFRLREQDICRSRACRRISTGSAWFN